jgi:3-deoxy-manno-octulosonate cytidylyltransferase (CMP-KDO synthetase)
MAAMTAVGVIPARWQATRFPGKPLAPIAGVPMVRRVWDGARQAESLTRVIIATEDARVADVCRSFGAEVAMTRSDHETGTDRLAEVAAGLDAEVIVNIQGDEPLIEGWVIDAAVQALQGDASVAMATVVHPAEPEGIDDPNRVKVALDRHDLALYFSRSRIPALRDAAAAPRYWQHVGLYAYRRPFLLDFVKLERTPLERAEALEQLRAMEHGHRIRCGKIEGWLGIPVDVPADVARVEARLRELGRC